MSINNNVDTANIFCYCFATPIRSRASHPQVSNQYYIIGALLAYLVHSFLQASIQSLTTFILAKAVNIIAISILEKGWRTAGQSFRRGRTNKSNLCFTKVHYFVSWQNCFAISIQQITAMVTASKLVLQFQETLHSIIKFMITRDGKIITNSIHQTGEHFPIGQLADGRSLNSITCINQGNVRCLRQHILFILGNSCQALVIIYGAVDIVGI